MANESKYSVIISAVDQTQAAFNGIRDGLGKISGVAGLVTTALGAVGVSVGSISFGTMVKDTIDTADAMGKAAAKAGLATKEFSALAYAAKFSDMDVEAFGLSMKGLNTHIADAVRGGAGAQQSFTALGVSIKNQDGTLRDADLVLLDIADKFQKMPDGIEKSDLAVKTFGKSGLSMIPMLNAGADSIVQLTDEAYKMGKVIDGQTAAAAERFNDNMTRAGAGIDGLKNQIGIGLLPVLNGLMDKFMEAGGGMDEFGNKTSGALSQANVMKWAEGALTGLAWVVDSAHGVVVLVKDIGGSFGAMAAAVGAVLRGEFEEAKAINAQWQEDSLALYEGYEPLRDKTKKFFDELSRTVSFAGQSIVVDTAEHAAAAQAIYDQAAADGKAKAAGVTMKTTAELDKQHKIAEKYAEEAKKISMGEYDYAIAKIKERYKIELDAVKGMKDEHLLAAQIQKKMDDEIGAVSAKLNTMRIGANGLLTDATAKGAADRVAIEKNAAQAIAAAQQPAYAAKMAVASAGSWIDQRTSIQTHSVDEIFAAATSNTALPGFAVGGSFIVPGSGGTDTTPVKFMATPGELVEIKTPAQQRASAAGNTFNFYGINDVGEIMRQIQSVLRTNPGALSPGGLMARAG